MLPFVVGGGGGRVGILGLMLLPVGGRGEGRGEGVMKKLIVLRKNRKRNMRLDGWDIHKHSYIYFLTVIGYFYKENTLMNVHAH